MFIVVTGGSGSGKSSYAEKQVLDFGEGRRYYIATMQCLDEESKKRVQRHRAMRADKHFVTLECPTDLHKVSVENDSIVLLECMSNLTANEYFDGHPHTPQEVADKIMTGVCRLKKQCAHLIVVTNEVFSDGVPYDTFTKDYVSCLGKINASMAKEADKVVEVVYGIPLEYSV